MPPSFPSVEGAVRATERELRGGRRQHVPLRLLARVTPLGATAAGLAQGLARRGQSHEEQQAFRIHQRRASHHKGLRKVSIIVSYNFIVTWSVYSGLFGLFHSR